MSRCIYKSEPEMAKARSRVEAPKRIFKSQDVPSSVLSFCQGKKYWIKTFGCQANVRDEEILSGYFRLAGMEKAKIDLEADIVIINTCAVRENAEDKVYGEIGKFKAKSLKDKDFILGVCGCMMQQENMARKIMASYPFVNLIFGTHNLHNILLLLQEHIERKKDIVDVASFPGDIVENLPSVRLDSYKAYVNITYGCDKFCTYCIVPYTRGRERSRQKEDIIAECRALVEEGYQEITLLGQNVNSYGKDFHDGTSFASILEEVAELGIPRLRFMTSHPWDFSDEMIEVIAKHPNIMKCIHLPVQSGNTEVLKKMGRRYSRESYLDLVKRIRSKIPDVALTTDIIVGFPNETEEQFLDTLSLCKEVGYDAAFTFIYSPRKGTPAAAMKDNVSDEEKHRRFDALVKVVEEGVLSHSSKMVGHVYDVLVDGPSKKDKSLLSGYTESSKLVHFKGPSYLKGHIVPVLIKEDHAFSMQGELQIDPILVLANDAAKRLKETAEAKAYFEAKESMENDESLRHLRDEIEFAQRKMMEYASSSQEENYLAAKKEYASLKEEYEKHPLVINYASAVSNMRDLLLEVEGMLS